VSREERLTLVVEWQRQMPQWRAKSAQLQHGGQCQAAPLSKGRRGPAPKPPGRKPGAGPFRDREATQPEAITAPPVDVQGTRDACPAWGPLAEERVDLASSDRAS